MRKFVLTGLAILLALSLSTCEMSPLGGGGVSDGTYVFDVNGKLESVTAGFDDNGNLFFPAPSRSNRALSDAIAKSSYNFFEVVFHTVGSTVRTTWDYGSSGVIQGVPGASGSTGVDYDTTTPRESGDTNGAAVLFIGRKETMQLLAVGVLTHVNGTFGNTIINSDSRTATFTVASLQAGVWVESLGGAYTEITFTLDNAEVGKFPALGIDGTTLDDPLEYAFSFKNTDATNDAKRFTAIRSEKKGPVIHGRDPAFISTDGTSIQITATAYLSEEEDDTFIDVEAGDQLIPNDGKMELTTFSSLAAPDATFGITSLGFNIPVYAITTNGTPGAKQWFVSSGSNEKFLDNGLFSSAGGSILIYLGSDDDETVEIKSNVLFPGLYIVSN